MPVGNFAQQLASALSNRVNTAPTASGRHPDPEAPGTPPPDRTTWPAARVADFTSSEMRAFAQVLRLGDLDVRRSVIDDLGTFHRLSAGDVLDRCLRWEQLSLQEWETEDRGSEVARVRFYRTMQSWSFDLLWYAYLQTEGYSLPMSVAALRWAQPLTSGRRHLDFGSGVGVTSQLFLSQGWSCTLADISSTLLDFARFRLTRRDERAEYVDLTRAAPPEGAFDLITAMDTLAHVPDIYQTARSLHAALAPGGLLLANIDARPATPENAWHLYEDDLLPRYQLQRAGFEPIRDTGLTTLTAYRRVESSWSDPLRQARDWALLASPPRRWLRQTEQVALKTLLARLKH